MSDKKTVTINGMIYKVGFPECQGCENLCFPGPLTCSFLEGDDCEYPDHRQSAGPSMCQWKQDDDGVWNTSCGQSFYVDEGTPEDNRMLYCAFCGKELFAIAAKTEEAE